MISSSVVSSLTLISCLLLFSVRIGICQSTPVVSEVMTGEDGTVFASGFKVLYNLYDDCSNRYTSVSTCLKAKAVTLLDRVNTARNDVLSVADGVLEIVRTGSVVADDGYSGRYMDNVDNRIDNANGEQTDLKLNALLFNRITRFFNTYSLRFNFPKFSSLELQRSLEEGRGKMKKMMSMMMMAGSMKMMMFIPMMIKALFLLAGKAFIISKIALVLALIITLKKLLASKNEMHDHGWSSGGGGYGGHHGGWDRKRSLPENKMAHDLAYSAYRGE